MNRDRAIEIFNQCQGGANLPGVETLGVQSEHIEQSMMIMEQYTELLIKKCVDICNQGTATQTTCAGAATMIKEYFGIE